MIVTAVSSRINNRFFNYAFINLFDMRAQSHNWLNSIILIIVVTNRIIKSIYFLMIFIKL